MMKTFGLAVLVVGGMFAFEGEGQACTNTTGPGERGFNSATLIVKEHVAKNVGIPLKLDHYGTVSVEDVRSSVAVTVRSGTTVIDGALEPLLAPNEPLYRWKAKAGDTPVGALTVSIAITNRGSNAKTPSPTTDTVTIEDRVAVAQPTPATIGLERYIQADDTSPKIVCTRTRELDSCGRGGGTENVPTVWKGVPNVAASLAPAETPDQPLVNIATEIFGRDKSGSKSQAVTLSYTDLGPSQQPTVTHAVLDRTYDEYCITTTTSIFGVAETAVATSCGSPKIDLTVSNDEAVERIRAQTKDCDSTTYPAGTSAEDPTGAGEDGGGCSTSPRRSSGQLGLALALALIVTTRRRSRSSSC